MSKFITHEVKIRFSSAGQSEKTNHFVECDSTVDYRIMAISVHIGVHGSICKSEDHRLVSNKCLIMTFYIRYRSFSRTS